MTPIELKFTFELCLASKLQMYVKPQCPWWSQVCYVRRVCALQSRCGWILSFIVKTWVAWLPRLYLHPLGQSLLATTCCYPCEFVLLIGVNWGLRFCTGQYCAIQPSTTKFTGKFQRDFATSEEILAKVLEVIFGLGEVCFQRFDCPWLDAQRISSTKGLG